MNRLASALNHLYQTFSSYRFPAKVDMSPYRDPEIELGALRRQPLRQVTASELDPYAGHAMTTVGDIDLFKYALPRLLELTSAWEMRTSEEIILSKLVYAHWTAWPAQEQAAIRKFLLAWWADTLITPFDQVSDRSDTVLCAIAQAEADVAPYLECWLNAEGKDSIAHLASFVAHHWEGQRAEFGFHAFWNERERQRQQVASWLISPAAIDKIKSQIDAVLTKEIASLSDEILDLFSEIGYTDSD